MSQLAAYLSGLDWSPLLISLKTGIVATIISFFLGIYAARKVVKAGPRVKAVADGILTLYPRGDGNRISTHVPECQGSV